MLLAVGASRLSGSATKPRLRFAGPTPDGGWRGRRALMVDDAPAFELSFWCGTCQFLFQRLEGATATFSLDDGNGLADALGGIDEEVVSQFGVLLPEDRALYDLPDAPRPGPSGKAPVRLSPWFDSVLLAYARGRRGRILPDEYRDAVYSRINLLVRPTLLVDGLVAGTWSVEKKRREAVLTLRLLRPLRPAVWSSLVEEAERLVRFCQPDAATYQVTAAAE